MKKIIISIAVTTSAAFLIFLLYAYSLRSYHFSGDGTQFDAWVNSAPGKYIELVVRSKSRKSIENIEYKLHGRFGLKSSGTIATVADGYYINSIENGNSMININRVDVITLELNWDGQTEIIKMINKD